MASNFDPPGDGAAPRRPAPGRRKPARPLTDSGTELDHGSGGGAGQRIDAPEGAAASEHTHGSDAGQPGALPVASDLARPGLPAPALLAPQVAAARLDPTALDEHALAAIARFAASGESPNTRRSYTQALRYLLAWFELRYGREMTLPVHPAAVAQFVVDHAETHPGERDQQLPEVLDRLLVAAGIKAAVGPLSLNTIELRLAALGRLHRDRRLDSPLQEPALRKLLRNIRATYARAGVQEKKKAALHAQLLERLLATCGDSPLGVRDRALLAFGFATGGRRRSEIAAADFSFLAPTQDGWSYTLAHSKTNQTGAYRPENVKPLVGAAAAALTAWIDVLELQGHPREGRIFRRVLKGGWVGEELSAHAVREIVKRRCALAGLTEGDFSAHSLRSGFMTEAGKRNVPLRDAMAMSGHASVATAVGYMRAGELAASPAAWLLEPKKPAASRDP